MALQLKIDYPETLPDVLQETREQFEYEAKMAMAAKLFEMKRLSSSTAASLVGMDRVSFFLSAWHDLLVHYKQTVIGVA